MDDLDGIASRRAKEVDAVAARYEALISSPEEQALWTTFREHWAGNLAVRAKIMAAARSKDQSTLNDLYRASRQPFEAAVDTLDRDTALNVEGVRRPASRPRRPIPAPCG